MSLMIEVLMWLLVESMLSFVFYSTGCLILKVLTLGQYKTEFKNFSVFKANNNKKINSIWLLGLFFHILLIGLIVYLNS